jgi:hypothetical protein
MVFVLWASKAADLWADKKRHDQMEKDVQTFTDWLDERARERRERGY